MRRVLAIEMRGKDQTLQRFVPFEELPLQKSQGGRQVAWDIKNGVKQTPDWGINMGVIEVDERTLGQLQRGQLRYDFNAQETVRAR